MSELKCPICGNDLEQYDTGLVCYRHCLNGKNVWGSEETLKELDRTRKALDCAINTLDTVYGLLEDDGNIETYIKCKRIEINGITKGGDNE